MDNGRLALVRRPAYGEYVKPRGAIEQVMLFQEVKRQRREPALLA
jgi:hypothetical protein